MKKILTIIFGLMCCASIYASQSITVVCPKIITCNYHRGTCDFFGNNYKWKTDGSFITAFNGSKTLNLTYIMGTRSLRSASLICLYAPAGHIKTLKLTIKLRKLVGTNWVIYGWGNEKASCPVSALTDPATCAAE